jgi:formate dehydrogenase major subunit
MVQWRHKAVNPPGDARPELDFYYELGLRLRERLAGSTDPKDRALLDLTWDYEVDEHGEPKAGVGAGRDQRHLPDGGEGRASRCPASRP